MFKKIVFLFLCIPLFIHAQQLLTPEKLMDFKRLGNGVLSPDEKYFLYSQTMMDWTVNTSYTEWFVIDLTASGEPKTARKISDPSFPILNVQWAGNFIYFLHIEKNIANIWKMNADGSEQQQISHFTKDDLKIEGFRISPNEQHCMIVHLLKNRKTIAEEYADLPLANVRIENDLMYRHWDSWNDNTVQHLFYYPIQNGTISRKGYNLNENSSDSTLILGGAETIAFHPNSSTIAYVSKALSGIKWTLSTNSEIYEVDLNTKIQRCVTCDDRRFGGYDLQPSYSSQGELAWLSMERDGFEADKKNIVVRTKNNDFQTITQKQDITVDAFSWHPNGKEIYAIVPHLGADQIFKITIASKQIEQMTAEKMDNVSISVAKNTLYVGRRSMLRPIEYFTFSIPDIKNKQIEQQQLTHANTQLLDEIAQPTMQEHWFETTDGKKMHVWMILPPNFDPTKKYPTLLYCQGGPQGQVSQFFSYRWNFMLMASQGYIVVAPNRRGLPGFGQQWNDAISKDWGGQAIQDYLTAIDSAVGRFPYIDKNRIGAIGASYGGYSVYMLAGLHQNRFKTFVAHCGLFNLESWYGTTDELFFANWDIGGPYWKKENAELYRKNSPHRLVQNWNTPILVIHGGHDFRVPETEGMQAFQAAQILGIKSRFLYFPLEGHWVLKPQNSLVWHREFFKWLAEDLK